MKTVEGAEKKIETKDPKKIRNARRGRERKVARALTADRKNAEVARRADRMKRVDTIREARQAIKKATVAG